jgi:TonB family protein
MRVWIAFIGSVAVVAASSGFAAAQDASPVPAGSPTAAPISMCAVPNAPAEIIDRAVAVKPPIAAQQNVSGTVSISVALDRAGRVVSATVVGSPSALLNQVALAAARQTTFRPPMRNCTPVPGSYTLAFAFPREPQHLKPPAMTSYFFGTWTCTSGRNAVAVQAFGFDPGDSGVLMRGDTFVSTDRTIGASIERYTESGDTTTVTGEFAGRLAILTAHGWNDDRLVFTGSAELVQRVSANGAQTPPAMAERMTYARTDNDHYALRFDIARDAAGPWTETSHSTCARIAAPTGGA